MNTHRFRSLIWLVGCLGCAVLADEATDSPTRELLDSYPYQPAVVALPAQPAPPATLSPEVAPGFVAFERDYRTYEALQAALDREKQKKDNALYVWNLEGNAQLTALGTPSVRETIIPWSPMTTTADVTFTPDGVNSATSKLQARFPLLSLSW